MKADKFRELDPKEMELKLREIDEQIFHLRLQMSLGQMDGLKKYRELRKDKARILTVKRERELKAAEAK
ncbi:MAG: 50S ribosomal protein L29 [Bryobacteraceae bacterium]